MEFIRAIFGCKEERLSVSYLGIPIGKGKIEKEWFPLIDTIERKLEGLKAKSTSLGGHLVLMNTILSAMPLCLMSVAILPRWVRQRIDRIQSRFLWLGQSRKSTIT